MSSAPAAARLFETLFCQMQDSVLFLHLIPLSLSRSSLPTPAGTTEWEMSSDNVKDFKGECVVKMCLNAEGAQNCVQRDTYS